MKSRLSGAFILSDYQQKFSEARFSSENYIMSFSKLPRVLISEEASKAKNPGPGDYDPKEMDRSIAG